MLYINLDFGCQFGDFAPMLVKFTVDAPEQLYVEWIPVMMFYDFTNYFSEC